MYIVEERYEHWGREGKQWTNWFRSTVCDTKEKAEENIKDSKELCKSIDKATKLKHEFKLREMTPEEIESYNKPITEKPKKKRNTKKKNDGQE